MQINVLQAKKKFEILDAVSTSTVDLCPTCIIIHYYIRVCYSVTVLTLSLCSLQMLSFMRAQYTLFQQGFNILDEIDPYMKKLAAQV